MTQSVSSKSIEGIAASKLTGALPALNGAALSNVSAGVYFNASDPTISSNKSLGFLWANSTSGEMFMCTDATAGANVWTNIGGGSGDVEPFRYQGTVSGYVVGGYTSSRVDIIDKYSFTSDGNGTDVGNLTGPRNNTAGNASATHGYTNTGYKPSTYSNEIEKFSFVTDINFDILKDYKPHSVENAKKSDE